MMAGLQPCLHIRNTGLKGKQMSAPQTNIEKQKHWHRGPLVGMAAGILFVGLMFLWLTGSLGPDEPDAPVATEQGGVPTVEGISPDATVVPPAPASN
jgi:hypothetical protein